MHPARALRAQAGGARSARLSIATNASATAQTVALSGTGGELPQGPKGETGADGLPGPRGKAGLNTIRWNRKLTGKRARQWDLHAHGHRHRDLVIGSELTFTDRGEHELKGIPDRWPIYAAAT